ncbi:MAG: hypothetical protein JXR60_05690 [Bacteroidales bacterium]|nr:hypothetical protein [Bacteroidales bacterium]
MKKIFLVSVLFVLSMSVFAHGFNNKGLGLMKYNPNPTSGDVGSALNLYLGPGNSNGFGFTFGADFEIPLIDPNLTIGPGVGFGIGHASYWGYSVTTTDIKLDAIAYYYFDWLIPSMPDQFDVFINSTAGIKIRNTTERYESYYYGYDIKDVHESSIVFDFETYVGGRWNFSDKMSLYAKAGYGSYYGAFGISFKF